MSKETDLVDQYCEGWCNESGEPGKFSDCTGCEIAKVIKALQTQLAIDTLNPNRREHLNKVLAENKKLRQMLAMSYAGSRLYCDDGELQDGSRWPAIDFKRDPVEEIGRKMILRTEQMLQDAIDTTWIPRPDSAGWWWQRNPREEHIGDKVVFIALRGGQLSLNQGSIPQNYEWSGPINPPFDVREIMANEDANNN